MGGILAMPDIQKCNGNLNHVVCEIRQKCYRFTATDSHWQSYGPPASDFQAKKGCELYMKERGRRI